MTMVDGLCDVCNVNPPIGVASTMIPYSCAYCRECAERNAQPDIVFACWFDDIGTDFEHMHPAALEVETFKDGRYVSYREWALALRKEKSDGSD